MTRLFRQIDNDNEFGLAIGPKTDTQYSDARHMMHAPLTTPHPSIAATAPMDTSGLEYIGATMSRTSTTPSKTHPQTAGVAHSLEYRSPIFNGDRDKSELFGQVYELRDC